MTTSQYLHHTTDTAFDPATLASDLRLVCDIYDAFFDHLDRRQWDTRTRGSEEWTLHETIAHLCALNGAGLDSMISALRGDPYTFVGLDTRYDLDAYNRHGIEDHLNLSSTELFAELLRVHSRAAELAQSLTPAQAERTVTMPIYNRPIQIVEALAIIVMHAGLVHTAQIAEPAGVPPLWSKLSADVRHRQIGRAVRAFSLLYRHDIGDPLRASFRFRVDGPGGGDWHVDVSPEATASGEGAPSAPRLSLRFRTTDEFCRMLTVRLNVPLALVTRRLRLRGDLRLFRRMNKLFSVDAHP